MLLEEGCGSRSVSRHDEQTMSTSAVPLLERQPPFERLDVVKSRLELRPAASREDRQRRPRPGDRRGSGWGTSVRQLASGGSLLRNRSAQRNMRGIAGRVSVRVGLDHESQSDRGGRPRRLVNGQPAISPRSIRPNWARDMPAARPAVSWLIARLPALDQQFPTEFRPDALSGATPAELVTFLAPTWMQHRADRSPEAYCSRWRALRTNRSVRLLAIGERFGGCGARLLALGEQKRERRPPGPPQRSLGEHRRR